MRTLLTLFLLSSALLNNACSGPQPEPSAPTEAPATSARPAPTPPTTARPDTTMPTPQPNPSDTGMTEVATLANGCFWCTEAVLEQLDGVLDVTSGYMGGHVDNPTYEQVCAGTTGHAECVQVTFDSKRIGYEALLDWFFRSHDPTTKDRQGNDIGPQYRSAVFFHSAAQEKAARAAIATFTPQFAAPIVTEVTAASRFWPAETYHQGYFQANPQQGYCRAIIAPKLKKLGLDACKK